MTAYRSRPEMLPIPSSQAREETEVIKLIRKLRWSGMDDEAQRILELARAIRPTDSVVADPREID